MLNYNKFGSENWHSQILSLPFCEEEVCKILNQAVTLPVGRPQRHHAHAAQTGEIRAHVHLGKRKHW